MIRGIYQKISLLCTTLCLIWLAQPVYAQVTYLGSQFYENPYLGNPAMVGVNKGVIANLAYRNQWRGMAESPVTESLTVEYGTPQLGVGLNVYNDKAALLGRLRVVGSYSYHLPLDYDSKRLHFGVSLGIANTTFDKHGAIGDSNDELIEDYYYKPYLVGDFGVAYTNEKLTLQAALPNMKKYFEKDERDMIDRATFMMSVSYKVALEVEGLEIEPRFGYRGAKGMDNILDIGTSVNFSNDLLTAMGMYHSNKSFTLGFGFKLEDRYSINGYYTTQFALLNTPFGGDFEIGLRASLF